MSSASSYADRRPRLPRRRSGERRRRAARSAAAGRSRSSTRARGRGRPRVYTDEEVAAFHEAMEGSQVEALRDPRRLPAQLRLRGSGDARQVADRAEGRAERRRAARRRRRRPAPGLGAQGRRLGRGGAQARRRRSIKEALAESERLPAAPRGHRRRRRDARALVRGARDADRARPAAASGSASAWTPATCSPPATTSAPRESLGRWSTSSTASSACDRLGALHVNDSMTAAGLQPRPPRQPRRRRDRRRGHDRLPVRAALRGPAGDLRGPGADRQGDRAGGHGVGVRAALARPRPSSCTTN